MTRRRRDLDPSPTPRGTLRALTCCAAIALASIAASPALAGDTERAAQLFEESARAYRAGDFDRAVELLKEAHGLTGEAVLLFNLAKAKEGKGDLEGAVEAYERYLREAKELPDRGAIERRVQTLRGQLDAKRALVRSVEVERQRAREAARPKPKPSPVPWVVAGVGGAGLVAAGVLGGLAASKESAGNAEPVQLAAAARRAEAQRLATASNVTLAASGAVLAGGVVWGVVDVVLSRREGPRAAALRAAIGPMHLGVVLTVSSD